MVFDAAGSRKTPTREASCGVRDVPGVRGKPEDPTREAFRHARSPRRERPRTL